MRTVRTKVYKFNELSKQSQQKAIEKYQETQEFFWVDEWISSIKNGLKNFGAKLTDWSISYTSYDRSSFSIENNNENTEELTGLRLRTWLLNNYYSNFFEGKPYGVYQKNPNTGRWFHPRISKVIFKETCCPFTGYCGDENFMDIFREFIKKPDGRNLDELLNDAVEKTIKGLQDDCESQQEDEYIAEHMEANGYEFTQDGERW